MAGLEISKIFMNLGKTGWRVAIIGKWGHTSGMATVAGR